MTEHKQTDEDLSAEELQKRLAQIEAEAEQLAKMQQEVNKDLPAASGQEDKEATDARSVHVGNVDFSSTPEELQEHFKACGVINRITILCDKFGNPKGYAYIEFAEPEAVAGALVLNESVFKGRVLRVSSKRTNVPGLKRGRGGRGGYRGRGGGPPAFGGAPQGYFYSPYRGGGRGGRGGAPRGGRPSYAPY